MLSKITAALVLFVASVQVSAGTPPACLIAAVNTQPDPADVSAVCSGSNATAVEQFICQKCGGNINDAFTAFTSYCGHANVKISNPSCSNSTSSSAASSSTGTSTGSVSSGVVTSTTNGTVTTTGSSSLVSTTMATSTTASATAGSHSTGSSSGSGTAPATSLGSGSGSGSGSPFATSSSSPSTPAHNAASRLGMDIVGMAALGVFGAMLAL